MGSGLSKTGVCMVWCGEDDSHPDSHEAHEDDSRLVPADHVYSREVQVDLPACSNYVDLCPIKQAAPSTSEDIPRARCTPNDVISSHDGLSNVDKKGFKPIGAEATFTEEPFTSHVTTRELLISESSGMEAGGREGLKSFFHSGGDELIQDTSWSRTKRGPSLAELLQRVEYLGNVDLALSEIRSLQKEEDRCEETIRTTVLKRFLLVMGCGGPGLAVRKCQRSRKSDTGGAERGKWITCTIRFESDGPERLPDGTPLGGLIVWNSKRLFIREQRGVSIADIVKVEHCGKCVWIIADGDGKLGFETSSSLDAKFLSRCVNFLVSAAVQLNNLTGQTASKPSSLRSTTTDINGVYAALTSDGG